MLFQHYQYASDHFARSADDIAEFQARDSYQHAVRMGHRARFLAEPGKRARHAASHVKEGQVTDLLIHAAQAMGELFGDDHQQIGKQRGRGLQALVADLGDVAGDLGAHHGAALGVFAEQTDLAKELTGVQVGEHQLVALFVLDAYRDRTAYHVIQVARRITLTNDGALGRHVFAMAMT